MRINVTLFTKRYIAFEYAQYYDAKNDVYSIPPTDELFQQLFHTTNTKKSKKLSNGNATTCINIQVKSHFQALINAESVGLRLHYFIKNKLCWDVGLQLIGQLDNSKNIRYSLQNWLSIRGIEDEEFSLETAVKTFYRFRQKKDKKKKTNIVKSCTPFVLSSRNILHYSEHQEFENILRGYVAANEGYFLTTAKKPMQRRIKQCRCFIYRKIGGLTTEMIAKKTTIPKRTVQHAIRRFDLFLKSKPNLPFPTI